MCSPTSCARNSYETLLRSEGSISICPRRIRMLHIAMNEHGLPRRVTRQKNGIVAVINAPVVVLGDDIACARFSRWRSKVDGLEIPNLLVRGLESTTDLLPRLLLTRRACLASVLLVRACATWLSTCLSLFI